MSWRISIDHRSRYCYENPVIASFNEARITPKGSGRQTVLQSSITVDPQAVLYNYVDYWRTLVVAFDVAQPHDALTITGSAVVETSEERRGEVVDWHRLHDPRTIDRLGEFLVSTTYTASNEELTEVAIGLTRGQSPEDAVQAISEWVRQVMAYEPGTTEVSTSALEAWHQGSGVCQDFAHLTIALLRAVHIPARYVSGYLHPDVDAPIGDRSRGASHAWIEAWIGSWRGLDPTNGSFIAERHVTVARGRDYADVTPFRGVYQGGALERLDVDIELTRLS